MRTLAVIVIAGLALASCGGGRRAGPPPMRPTILVAPEAFLLGEFDTDRDRIVSRAELDAGVDAAWRTLAGERETVGQLAVRDWLSAVLGGEGFAFSPASFDGNFDGQVTRAEFRAELEETFTRLDRNSDARVTRAELVSRPGVDEPEPERPRPEGPPPMRR